MKIAYLFEKYPTPTETFLTREIEALRRLGVQIEIYALDAHQGATPIHTPHRAFKVLGKRRYWKRTGRGLARQMRAANTEHIHAAWANHLAELAMATAQTANLPWSFAAHARDLWVDGGNLKAKLAKAKFAVTCTQAGERELKKYGSNVHYLPHGLEIAKYKFHPRRPGKMFEIVGVGRLVDKKGWGDALRALDDVLDGGVEARLTLVGEGPARDKLREEGFRLTAKWKQRGFSGSWLLKMRGQLRHSRAIDVMRECHCCVLPSRRTPDGDRDGLANVLLEAAALGLPIVTTNAGSAGDFVDDSTGIVVESGDVKALGAALLEVSRFGLKTQERCARARARVEADFDVDKNVLPLLKAFQSDWDESD